MGYPLVCLYPRLLAEVGYLGYNEDDDAIDRGDQHALVAAHEDRRGDIAV